MILMFRNSYYRKVHPTVEQIRIMWKLNSCDTTVCETQLTENTTISTDVGSFSLLTPPKFMIMASLCHSLACPLMPFAKDLPFRPPHGSHTRPGNWHESAACQNIGCYRGFWWSLNVTICHFGNIPKYCKDCSLFWLLGSFNLAFGSI